MIPRKRSIIPTLLASETCPDPVQLAHLPVDKPDMLRGAAKFSESRAFRVARTVPAKRHDCLAVAKIVQRRPCRPQPAKNVLWVVMGHHGRLAILQKVAVVQSGRCRTTSTAHEDIAHRLGLHNGFMEAEGGTSQCAKN